MYKKIIGIITLASCFAFSQTALAHAWCHEGMQKMVQSLQFSEEQKTKAKPIFEELKSSIRSNAASMQDISKEINQQVQSSSMDQSKVDDLVDKKVKLIGNMIKAKLTAKHQIIDILTPAQKTKLQGMMKKMEAKIEAKYKQCHKED